MVHCYKRVGDVLGVCLLLLLGLAAPAAAQVPGEVPEFEVDAVSARADGTMQSVRLDVYTRVPFTNLRFINTADGFTAEYEVNIDVYELDDRGRRQGFVDSRVYERTVRTGQYAETQNPQRADYATKSLLLPPGAYVMELQLQDQHSSETFVKDVPVTVRDLNRPVALSDLILVEDYDDASNTITPLIGGRIGTDRLAFRLFYELYAEQPRAVRLSRQIMRMPGGTATDAVPGSEALYTDVQPMELEGRRTQALVTIPTEGLKVGDYLVRVRVEDVEGRVLDTAERMLTVYWNGLDDHIRNLGDAIAQLQYIAKDRELRHIRGAETDSERLSRFEDFWEKRDPTPGTDRNERMEEYYYRIADANQRYGSLVDGWKTDRGQVMVLFGEPDHVDRHPYSFNAKPYEVWYYYRIGKRFIFIDETGLGDYQLLVPIWDERTRIR